MKKEQIINNYLYFGYLPPKSIPAWLNSAFKPSDAFDYSIEGASALFDKVFDELVTQHPDSNHLIPLSGGWDSRAILGALFERVDRSNIETVTFGVPGQLDYDVGIKIAKWAGIQLHALDLRQIEFTWDQLLKSVEKSPWTYVPDAYFNHFARSVETSVETIWTGFLGDPLTGSHLMDYSTSLYCQKSIREGQKKIQDIYLPNKLNEPIYNYKIDNVNIRIDDYLDLGVRQSYCIAPITLPVSNLSILQTHFEEENKTVIAPFAQFDFVNYWLKAPVELRKNQQLYLQMLKFKFQELFALPSKYSLGLKNKSGVMYHTRRIQQGVVRRIQKRAPWLGIRSTAHLNYLDYDKMFRTRPDYQNTLNEALDYLKENEITPWLPLDKMVKDHMHRKKEYGGAFCVLIGLAANLKVNYDS